MEQLAHRGNGCSEQNLRRAALLQGHLHRFRNAQADAVRGFQHKLAQKARQRPRVDVLHRDGAALGAGHRLLGHKDDVVRAGMGLGVFFNDVADVVLVGDDVGADGQALILDAVHLDDLVFTFVDNVVFFAHIFHSPFDR